MDIKLKKVLFDKSLIKYFYKNKCYNVLIKVFESNINIKMILMVIIFFINIINWVIVYDNLYYECDWNELAFYNIVSVVVNLIILYTIFQQYEYLKRRNY